MAIIATSKASTPRELIEPGNYAARCYKMIQIGTVEEVIQGEKKIMHKVRIGWELPLELKVFKEGEEAKPLVIDQEYTLSMSPKANLRRALTSWRGKDFTEEEAEAFDITRLLGVACMLNIIHKPSKKDPTNIYEEISSISTVPKGYQIPAQILPIQVLSFDNFNKELFESLPDFIKNKIKTSEEYKLMQNPNATSINQEEETPF